MSLNPLKGQVIKAKHSIKANNRYNAEMSWPQNEDEYRNFFFEVIGSG